MRLPGEVEKVVAGSDSCFVLEDAGHEVFSRNAEQPLVPASTQKLLTAAAALSALGADHRFETRVVAASRPSQGRVDGLWLVGGGDPLLSVAAYRDFLERVPLHRGHPATPLEDLADAVVAAGIREVTGGVIGDASRHPDARVLPTWKSSYIADHDVSFLSALTANGGWSAWEPQHQTAEDPPVYAAAEFTRLLTERGVVVSGASAAGKAPDGAVGVGVVG